MTAHDRIFREGYRAWPGGSNPYSSALFRKWWEAGYKAAGRER